MQSFFKAQPSQVLDKDGIYFTTIRDYQAVDMGTAVLYLERAMNQDCLTFLESLDLLFKTRLTGEARKANLNFICALKFINDCCVKNPTDKNIVTEIIESLSTDKTHIAQQKSSREQTEKQMASQVIAPTGDWRELVGLLPLQVMAYKKLLADQTSRAVGGVFTPDECLLFSTESKRMIMHNCVVIQELVTAGMTTAAQFKDLTVDGIKQLIEVHQLAKNNQLTLGQNDLGILYLQRHAGFTADALLKLSPEVLSTLCSRVIVVEGLVKAGYSPELLLSLPLDDLRVVLDSSEILNPPSISKKM